MGWRRRPGRADRALHGHQLASGVRLLSGHGRLDRAVVLRPGAKPQLAVPCQDTRHARSATARARPRPAAGRKPAFPSAATQRQRTTLEDIHRDPQPSPTPILKKCYCTRPPELDCTFESICETCTFFQTSIEFRPTLQRQHDDATTKDQTHRGQLFDQLLTRIDREASRPN